MDSVEIQVYRFNLLLFYKGISTFILIKDAYTLSNTAV